MEPTHHSPLIVRATGVKDILDTICEAVEQHKTKKGRISRATLACLCRVSKGFFSSATRVLWGGREIACKDILLLIPGAVLNDQPAINSGDSAAKDRDPSGSVPGADNFERFVLYAPHIKHLVFSMRSDLNRKMSYLASLRLHANKEPLFPNLISLTTRYEARISRVDHGILEWIEILAFPLAQRLHLSDNFTDLVHSRFEKLITRCVANCTNLRYLHFSHHYTHSRPMLGSIEKLYQLNPSNMIHYSCSYTAFTRELLLWLAKMEKLERLELEALESGYPSKAVELINSIEPEALSFPTLRHLVLHQCDITAGCLILKTPLVRHLTHLCIRWGNYRENWDDPEYKAAFKQLLTSCPNLYALDMLVDSPPPIHLLKLLSPLPIRKLTLVSGRSSSIGYELIQNLIDLWPTLRSLDLPSCEVTFDDLEDIIPLCPRLLMLRLRIRREISQRILNRTLKAPQVQFGTTFRLVSSLDQPENYSRMYIPPIVYEPLTVNALARYLWSLRSGLKYSVCTKLRKPLVLKKEKWLKQLNLQLRLYSRAYSDGQDSSRGYNL